MSDKYIGYDVIKIDPISGYIKHEFTQPIRLSGKVLRGDNYEMCRGGLALSWIVVDRLLLNGFGLAHLTVKSYDVPGYCGSRNDFGIDCCFALGKDASFRPRAYVEQHSGWDTFIYSRPLSP